MSLVDPGRVHVQAQKMVRDYYLNQGVVYTAGTSMRGTFSWTLLVLSFGIERMLFM